MVSWMSSDRLTRKDGYLIHLIIFGDQKTVYNFIWSDKIFSFSSITFITRRKSFITKTTTKNGRVKAQYFQLRNNLAKGPREIHLMVLKKPKEGQRPIDSLLTQVTYQKSM